MDHTLLVTTTLEKFRQGEQKVPLDGTRQTICWRSALLVAGVALAVRIIHVWSTAQVPTARHLIGDAAGYYEWSQRIAAGEWIGTKGFYQAPLYPYALAVWRLFGNSSPAAIQYAQALCGSAACALLCMATTRIFCAQIGLLAGFMLALYGPAIYFDGIIQKASLDDLLICAALACVAMLTTRPSAKWCAALGAIVSLLCLTRENAIAWHFVLVAWIAWSSKRCITKQAATTAMSTPTVMQAPSVMLSEAKHLDQTLRFAQGDRGSFRHRSIMTAAYSLGAAIVLIPVGVRNHHVQGEFVLTTSQAGPNFYIGNNARADGRYQPLIRGHETPTFEQADATKLAESAAGHPLSPREVSRYWMKQAWSDIAANPIRWLKLMGYKLLLVWNQYEIADAESLIVYRRYSPILGALSTFWHFGGLAPLALLGVALTWNDRRRLWVLYALIVAMTFSVAAFYVLARYRFPLVPLLMPFAAAGCVELWRRRGQMHTVVRPLSMAIATALLVNWPIQNERQLDALADMNAGVALAQAGEIDQAAEYFVFAVAGHPASAEANYNLALALALQGKHSEAIPYYENAIRSHSELIGAHYNLAVALEQVGRAEEALTHYEIAARQDPGDAEARAAIERLHQKNPDLQK